MADNDTAQMDEADQAWVDTFRGKSIPANAIVEGFVSVIAWMDEDGSRCWRSYTCLDAPLSHTLGLLEMAKFGYMVGNQILQEGEE